MELDRMADLEALFENSLNQVMEQVKTMGEVELVVGIPFYNEKELLPGVLEILDEGLVQMQASGKSLIVCAGDPAGKEALNTIKSLNLQTPHLEFLMLPGSNGRGASIRAILEIANRLESHVALFAADLVRDNSRGLQPDWIKRMVEPIRHEYDLVLTTFKRHHFEDLLDSLFAAPLLEVFYGYKIKGSVGDLYAFSHDLVEYYCKEQKFWFEATREFGIDPWLITRAICWDRKICEVELGAKLEVVSPDKLNYIFKETARSLFECIKEDEDYWLGNRYILKTPDVYSAGYKDTPYELTYSAHDLALFRYSYYQYRNLYDSTYYDYLYKDIGQFETSPAGDFAMEGIIWSNVVYRSLFTYWFGKDVCRDDVLNALTFSFGERVAGFIERVQSLQDELASLKGVNTDILISGKVASVKEEQREEFLGKRSEFLRLWQQKALETKPPIVPAHYLEFIPGIPIVLPKRLEGRGSRVVWTEDMFNQLQMQYYDGFNKFIHGDLQVPKGAPPQAVVAHVREFMNELEKTMEKILPGNLYTEEGTGQVVEELFRLIPRPKTYSIRDEIFREMLFRFPPLNVIIPAGCKTSRELCELMDVRDAVSLANLVETRKYGDRAAIIWILDNLRPDGMDEVEIKPLILGEKVLSGSVKLGSLSDLNKLTSRIVTRPLSKGMGGEFPKLRFTLFIGRHIMIAENYAYLWRTYAREKKNLGVKIRNSLVGRYETVAFSSHNIFENFHHRALVSQLRHLPESLRKDGRDAEAHMLEIMCNGYGLSQIMADGTFLPCSAWTWASYSYKGGKSVPTPLSSHVEEKWFNHDFLEKIYAELGYDPGEIMQMVVQLIGEGRASENLLDVLLGISPKDVSVVVQEIQDYPPAGHLHRYEGNPILSPIKEHYWESKYVLNAATLRIGDKVYILYRAFGDDEVSRIGLAVTDGYNVLERLPEPVFVPQDEREKKGVEDPRIVVVGDDIYMLYTAYDGVIAQISAASIKLEDFINQRFDRWVRRGLAFEDIWDKDAILFPEKVRGKYVIYHRIEPSIWVSYMDELDFPVPKEKHYIILGPRSGMMWDSLKIGAGTQPIKTRYGWLLIYHGVDRDRVYRLGVILVDLDNPERLLYRSPNPILSPETEHEIGQEGESWVPNVVFTCGAVPAEEKEVLDIDDEILVYYGAADTHVCLATARVGDLIPESVRRGARSGSA